MCCIVLGRGGSQGGPPRGSRGPPGAGGQSGSYYFRLLQNPDLQSLFLACRYMFGISRSSLISRLLGQGQGYSVSVHAVREWCAFH